MLLVQVRKVLLVTHLVAVHLLELLQLKRYYHRPTSLTILDLLLLNTVTFMLWPLQHCTLTWQNVIWPIVIILLVLWSALVVIKKLP